MKGKDFLLFPFLRLFHQQVSSSAPTTPSEGPVPQKQQHQNTNIPQTKISSAQLPSGAPPMASSTANRSRLVQELLEQNSAILQKLKDRPPSQDRGDSEIQNTKSGIQHHHHHPFPTSRQSIRPKEVALQLGLYSTTGSSASSTSQKYWSRRAGFCWRKTKTMSVVQSPTFFFNEKRINLDTLFFWFSALWKQMRNTHKYMP